MDIHQQALHFFNRFAEDFATADGALIAQRYGAPYLALSGQGQARVFADTQQISEYFQQVLDGYFRQGCRACRFRELQAQALGSSNLFASLTWELTDQAGHVLLSWRESYTLSRTAAGLRIHSSTDHAD